MIMTTVMMMIVSMIIIIITVVVIIMIAMIVIIITVVIIMITMIVIIITTVVAVRSFRTLMCAHAPSITDHSCMRHAPVKHLGAVQWNKATFQPSMRLVRHKVALEERALLWKTRGGIHV